MKQKYIKILSLISLFSILFLIVVFYQNTAISFDANDYILLNSNWNVTVNGKESKHVALNQFAFSHLQKGDKITLTTIIPPAPLKNPALEVYTSHSQISVSVNGVQIYEYGFHRLKENKLVGYGYHYIDMPEQYQYGTLKIELTISEDNPFTTLQNVYLCNHGTVMQHFISKNRLTLVIDLSLLLFGLILAVICLSGYIIGNPFPKLLLISFFTTGLGLWSLCNTNLIQVFTTNLLEKVYLENTVFFITPMFVFLYFKQDADAQKGALKIAYYVILFFQIVLWGFQFIMQALNLVHLPAFAVDEQIVIVAMFCVMFLLIVQSARKKEKRHSFMLWGMVILLCLLLLNMLQFNLAKFTTLHSFRTFNSSIHLGIMIFVICLLIDFMRDLTDALKRSAENEMLEKIAYTDVMTGLYNRRKCEALLDEFQKSKKEFAIINFDLNYLKRANDTLGHHAGDALLTTFSNALRITFENVGYTGRTGGDEFIAFMELTPSLSIENLLQEMHKNMEKERRVHPDIPLSVSYGFCLSTEFPEEEHQYINHIADERMYENKKKAHIKRYEEEQGAK